MDRGVEGNSVFA